MQFSGRGLAQHTQGPEFNHLTDKRGAEEGGASLGIRGKWVRQTYVLKTSLRDLEREIQTDKTEHKIQVKR